jgi:cytochrome bd ubiquinol oxidase subunit II
MPFLLTLALCFLGYSGLLISIWPNIVPPSLSIWEASSSHASQLFTLVGTVIVLPVILVYNAMQYRVFRGKVKEGDTAYH